VSTNAMVFIINLVRSSEVSALFYVYRADPRADPFITGRLSRSSVCIFTQTAGARIVASDFSLCLAIYRSLCAESRCHHSAQWSEVAVNRCYGSRYSEDQFISELGIARAINGKRLSRISSKTH
jgi:hypothetical protein